MKLHNSLPKDGTTYGVWLSKEDGGKDDVHVYAQHNSTVIGHNKDVSKLGFTKYALVFNADGSVTFQFDDNGTPKIVPVEDSHCYRKLREFLEDFADEVS
jgi:hypothetical protein